MHGPNAPRLDTLEQMCSPVLSTFSVPSNLHHVWAFQGKSLPAVTSMSAPLTVQPVSLEGSVEPSQAGRCTWPFGWSPFRLGSLYAHPYRRAGGNGYCFESHATLLDSGPLAISQRWEMVKARWLKEESPG